MRHIPITRYAVSALMLAVIAALTACSSDDSPAAVAEGDEEITVKLQTSTRATADPLVRDDDDHFTSLAVYAFRQDGSFVALYRYDATGSVNEYTTPAFNCGIATKKLVAVANYAAYADLSASLTKGLSETQVKALVANASGTTALAAGNILMAGEAAVSFTKPDTEDEDITVSLPLRRLAARVDLFVFKEAGWNDKVEVQSVTFDNGVLNTTLSYAEGTVSVPSSPVYAPSATTQITTENALAAFEGDAVTLWRNDDTYLRGRWYTYRTSVAYDNERAARFSVTVAINGTLTRTYTGLVASGTPESGDITLDAGRVYQVQAVVMKNGMEINTLVADWEDGGTYELAFEYPTYSNPMVPISYTGTPSTDAKFDQPTIYYDNSGSETAGTCSFQFSITGPVGHTWQPVLFETTEADYEVTVLLNGAVQTAPYGICSAGEHFEIRVKALKNDNAGNTVPLGISYTPAWELTGTSLLLINGSSENTYWTGSDDPMKINILQTDQPTTTNP